MEQQCYSFWRIFQTFQSNTERQTVVTLTANVVLNKWYLITTKMRYSRRTSNASKRDTDTSTWPTWKGGQPHPQLAGMQAKEASPHPPPASGATAQWEAKRKESAPTHNFTPPVACREQHRPHPLPARQPPPTHRLRAAQMQSSGKETASATARCGEDWAAT